MYPKSINNRERLAAYVTQHSARQTEVQEELTAETLKHPDGYMLSDPQVLQLLANLIQAINAKKVLDVGVFTGASALSAAMALPGDGVVHALDVSEEHTHIAKKFWSAAGVSHKITLHVALAEDTLQNFIDSGEAGTFDFAYIDADKEGYDHYYELCLVLVRRGGIIAFDNTLWSGSVIDPSDQTSSTVAIRKLNEKLRDDQRINLSFLNIGDGLSLCFIK